MSKVHVPALHSGFTPVRCDVHGVHVLAPDARVQEGHGLGPGRGKHPLQAREKCAVHGVGRPEAEDAAKSTGALKEGRDVSEEGVK